jgi:hypothetical protein
MNVLEFRGIVTFSPPAFPGAMPLTNWKKTPVKVTDACSRVNKKLSNRSESPRVLACGVSWL